MPAFKIKCTTFWRKYKTLIRHKSEAPADMGLTVKALLNPQTKGLEGLDPTGSIE
jgi:hypothetical protein